MPNLKYPLVCFDLDGTLVDDTIYIWKTLHEAFQTDVARRRQAYEDYFAKRITYPQWFENDLDLLREAGATRESILRTLNGLQPMKGATELLTTLKARGHIICVVSGSLDVVIEHLFDIELFDHIFLNHIHFDEHGAINGGQPTPYDLEGKAEGLQELARLEGIPIEQTAFVGDNQNDLWIAEAAGLAIAFNCKSEQLRKVCQIEVTQKDLRELASIIC